MWEVSAVCGNRMEERGVRGEVVAHRSGVSSESSLIRSCGEQTN